MRVFNDLADAFSELDENTDPTEIVGLLTGDEVVETSADFDAICFELQGVADANSISVNLECGDDE